MKIEVELEDKFYHALSEMLGDIDIGLAVSEILKHIVIMYSSNPNRFMEAWEDRESEAAKSLDSQIRDLTPQIFDKAKTMGELLSYLKEKEEKERGDTT